MESRTDRPARQHPWFKFYPSDWLGNLRLRRCSDEVKATLVDVFVLAHSNEPYGFIPTGPETAVLIGRSERSFGTTLLALVETGLVAKSVDGRFFVPHLVRDRQKALAGVASAAVRNGRSERAFGTSEAQKLRYSEEKSISKEIPPPVAAKPRAKPTGPQAEIVEHYSKLYQACYGEPPAILWGRDGSVVKKMLAFAGGAPEKVKEKIELAFKDDFCRDTAKVSLGVVLSRWNALLPKTNYNPPVSVSVPKKKERRVYPTELEAWKEITGHGGHAEQVEGGWIFIHGED